MSSSDETTPRRGRKRSEHARRAILDAGLALVGERGYAATTMEAIAERAGVGKQTVYRWWPSKADVVLDALNETAMDLIPVPDTASPSADLAAFLRETFATAHLRPELPVVLRSLMAAAQLDETFGRRFQHEFLERRRTVLRELLERSGGSERPAAELDVVVDAVYGFLWYRMLAGHATLDRASAEQLAALVLA